jgi:flavin-binding protein dodecin
MCLAISADKTSNSRKTMSVAKVREIIAASDKSFEDAVNRGIKRASGRLKN